MLTLLRPEGDILVTTPNEQPPFYRRSGFWILVCTITLIAVLFGTFVYLVRGTERNQPAVSETSSASISQQVGVPLS
jgi:hypothetical protein